MTSTTVTEASANLGRLMDETAESHEPILITAGQRKAVLVSAEDWESIQETLYLLSVPRMRESILAGLSEPLDSCSTEPGW